MRRRASAGLALPTVMMVGFLVVLLAMTLVSVAGLDVRIAHRQVEGEQAFEAAQAALSEALYSLSVDASWGTHNEVLTDTLQSNGCTWRVSFSPDGGRPWSCNNLRSPSAVAGYEGRVVPPRSALLMASGTSSGGHTRVIEALVEAPPMPYAIAATGAVTAGSSLQLDGASTLSLLLGGVYDAWASVYAGSTADNAVTTGISGSVSGEIRTRGKVSLGAGTTVLQGVVEGAPAQALPDISIQDYNTAAYESRTELVAGTYGGQVRLSGPVYAYGDVSFRGNVFLDGATLFIDGGGNLQAQGNVHGTGSIFSTGSVFLKGNIDLVASDGIAVFSQNALTLTGGNFFQGLLYSHHSVVASKGTTVIGAIVCSGTSSTPGTVELHQGTHVSYVPEYARLLGTGSSAQTELRVTSWREVATP